MSKFERKVARARAVDILSVIHDRGLQLKGKQDLAGPCPVCGGTDRFAISLKKQVFCCRGCKPEGGDVIDLVKFLDDVDFKTAVGIIAGDEQAPLRERARQSPKAHHEISDNRETAQWLWSERRPVTDDCPVGLYLRGLRGYHGPVPATLGYLPANGKHSAAMIAAFGFCDEPEPGVITPPALVRAVHITRLTPVGEKIAEKSKIMLGEMGGLPIVLAPANDLLAIDIVEGIETGLSVVAWRGAGVWVAGSAGNMPKVAAVLPAYVECVHILAERDGGFHFAQEAARIVKERGIEIHLQAFGGR